MRIRPAEPRDALDVAAIVDIAGHGIDLAEWISRADGDRSTLVTVRDMVRNDRTWPYHHSRAQLIEIDGEVAGGVVGSLVEEAFSAEDEFSDHIRPLVTLENQAIGFWSILAIALYPEFRGRGLGAILLDQAEKLARSCGALGLSLAVEDNNEPALRVYGKAGFREEARLPWIPYGGRSGPDHWLMLVRQF